MQDPERKIPFNYTSASDQQIIRHLFGSRMIHVLDALEPEQKTGRSSRRLYRFMGDLFIIERNRFLFQEIVAHPRLKKRLFNRFATDLDIIENNADNEQVLDILSICRQKLEQVKQLVERFESHKHQLIKTLSPVIGKENIYTDAFNLTAHSTDATDWRMYMPVGVLRPDREDQLPRLMRRIKSLGFHVIPRGAGTGLTGGATPLKDNCLIVNTEKLNRISPVQEHVSPDNKKYASIKLGAGVITQDAMTAAKKAGYIFATDPTSSWACTIGGNLSENAGGKKAVLFGTAIDNVLSYGITLPDGRSFKVKRKDHPLRKILPGDTVRFDICSQDGAIIETINLPAEVIRKKGLGKDITNKTLMGLPGIQKEGCDGIITSARFILYPEFKVKKTLCIEFFGSDMKQAGHVIAEITGLFSGTDPALLALEHFDEEYIKAIGYKTKTAVGSRLIAVLLVDLVSNNEQAAEKGILTLQSLMEQFDKTGCVIARNETEADRFWQDRRRLGAIAAHTNAFKLNEDIVLPIKAIAGFAGWVDQTNIEEKKHNQIRIIDKILAYLDTAVPLSDPDLLTKRVRQAKDLAYNTKKKMQIASRDAIEAYIHAKNFRKSVLESLRGYSLVTENVTRIYEDQRKKLIVIATHMHAGDGNIHVNIPVFSNDRQMMERAEHTAGRVMEKAVELGGVVSGEHGIGITKIKHLDKELIESMNRYREKADPDGMMNPDKLVDTNIIEKVYTPSFNLLKIESKILNYGSLYNLSKKVSGCVRCGKCKIECPVFFPGKNMFYHPRNKNLAIGSLIEALLYISQRIQSTQFQILKQIETIADHCTICHKCFLRCPVNIDSGEISIAQRDLLEGMSYKKKSVAVKSVLYYLATDHSVLNPILRTLLLQAGGRFQQGISKIVSPFQNKKSCNRSRWIQMLDTPVATPHSKTLRSYVPKGAKNQTVVIEPEAPAQKTVFYFPGCGSERIFSKISMAGILLLLKTGTRVVLPPGFMCCGYPFSVNGDSDKFNRICVENSICFSQIRSMFEDIRFDACVVSCGTCMDTLKQMGVDQVFDCAVKDLSAYILSSDQSLMLPDHSLYHAPCHNSLEPEEMAALKARTTGGRLDTIPYCCSEAGTLSLSKPHISNAMLDRKQKAYNRFLDQGQERIITNCPSCLQGLGRLKGKPADVKHLTQVLAHASEGKNWMASFKKFSQTAKVVTY